MKDSAARRALAVLALGAGCATTQAPVTKIVGGRVIVTRPVSPQAYEHVTRAFLYEEEGRWEEAAVELQRALPFDDEAAEVRAHLAEVFMRLGRLDDAAAEIERSLAIAPTVGGLVADAHLRERRGDAVGGVEMLRRAVALATEDRDDIDTAEEASLELADAQTAALDVEGAYETARALVRFSGETVAGRLQAAGLGWALGKTAEAEAALREVLAEEPAHIDALVLLGQLQTALGRTPEARATFTAAIDRVDDRHAVAEPFVRWLAARGDLGEARAVADRLGDDEEGAIGRAALERAAQRPERARAIAEKAIGRGEALGRMTIVLAGAEEDAGNRDAAIKHYLSVPADLPEAFEARLRAAAVLREAGRLDEAARVLGEVKPRKEIDEDLVVALALLDEKRGDGARAARRLDEAIAKLPASAPLLLTRAALEERRGGWKQALGIAEKALAIDPRSAAALNFLGFIAADRGHDLPRALGRARAAMALEPGSGGIIDSVGWACFKAGDIANAAAFLEQAARIEPGDPEILAHIGDLELRRGQRALAVESYRKALARKPDDRLRRDIEERVRALEAKSAAGR